MLPKTPGLHTLTLEKTGQRCAMAIPNAYSDSQPLPFILALHWGGPITPDTGAFLLQGLILPGLGELNALVAAPNRLHENWANPKSEQNLLELINYFHTNFNIDSKRSLITGYSLGGIGTWYFVSKHPEYFSAAIPLSARPPENALNTHWNLPFFVIHSRRDELFPYQATEKTVHELKEKGTSIELVTVETAGHFDTHHFVSALEGAVPWVKKIWDPEE